MSGEEPVAVGISTLAVAASIAVVAGVAYAQRARGLALPVCRRRVAAVGTTIALYMIATAAAAVSGTLTRFDVVPPPMAIVFGSILVASVVLGLSPIGRALAHGLPLWLLVVFQAFRLPLELVMHHAATIGLMPRVMSYSGYNFDILTGTSALVLGVALRFTRVPTAIVWIWNIAGTLLVLTIAAIAVAASPLFAWFGPDQLNVWVTRFPYVWIGILVGAAIAGHIVVFRRLVAQSATARIQRGAGPGA
jgi:hypothetical protein